MGDVTVTGETGSPPAWDPRLVEIYERRAVDFVRLAYLLTGNRAAAEELTHDVFIATHAAWTRVEQPEPYVRKALVNACHSWFRRRDVEQRHRPAPPEPTMLGADELWDALNRLPYRRRAAVVLRFYEDLPDAEIAKALGCRPSTVRTTIHRALAYVCPSDGCPVGEPTQDVRAAERADLCEVEVALDTPLGYLNEYGELHEGENVVAVSTPAQGCDYIGPPTDDHDEAATDLLMHQVADGWVPYGGEPALEGAVWPSSVDEAWVRPGLLEDPGCSRPSGIGATVDFQCVYAEAEGEIIGYHFSVLGYVPVDRIDEFDPDRAFVELWGCSPEQDPTCQARHNLEQARAQLSSDDLTPEQRVNLEQVVAQLEETLQSISE